MTARTASFLLAFVLFGFPILADSKPARADSKQVRMVYDRFNAPDSKVFSALLRMIRTYPDDHSQAELEDWVWGEMNMTRSRECEAWVIPRIETQRHSKAELQEFVDILQEVADQSFEAEINLGLELFCPVDKFTSMAERIAALERRDVEQQVEAENHLSNMIERMG